MGWKKKKKRRKVAEKNKALKRQKKVGKDKIEKGELWQRLKTLNKKFKTISDANIKK